MGKYLRDIDLYMPPSEGEEAVWWSQSINFLEVLYLDSLPRVETHGVPKVVLTPCRRRPRKPLKVLLRNPEILQLFKIFDFESYRIADKETRKRIALDFLQQGLLEVATKKGWNIDPFLAAYNKIVSKNLICHLPFSKRVFSPNLKLKAQVWCNYDSDAAHISVVIFSGNKPIKEIIVSKVKPGDVWIRETVGELKWVSNNSVVLTAKDKSDSWEVHVL